MKINDIAAVVPVYNPEPGLQALCVSLLDSYGTVVVVDDGSTENVEDFKTLPEGINLVRHEVNRGKGRAIKTSIEWLMANRPDLKAAVFVDGDGQHRPDDVAEVVAKCRKTGNVVLGVRDFSKQNIPFRSRFGNIMTSFLVRLMYRVPIYDTQTGLRAIPSRLFGSMLQMEGERYEYEMRLFGMLDIEHETLEQVPIETIYISNNRASHFHPIRDSIKVYRGLFGGRPAKFVLSSLIGFGVDIGTFSILICALGRWSPLNVATAILVSHIVARVLSAVVNYQCNRRMVFETKTETAVSVRRYAALALTIWFLSYVLTTVFALTFNSEGLRITAIKVVMDIVLFILSYQVQKCWVFGRRPLMSVPFVRRTCQILRPVLLFFPLFVVDSTIGMIANWEYPTWRSWATIASRSLAPLMLVMSFPLFVRRDSRFIMPLLFLLVAVFEAVDLVAFLSFRITVRGEVFAILLGSSREETLAFFKSFVSWTNVLLLMAFLTFLFMGCRSLWRKPGVYPRNRLMSYVLGFLLAGVSLVSRPPTEVLFVDFVTDTVCQYARYRNLAFAVRHPDLSDVEVIVREVVVVRTEPAAETVPQEVAPPAAVPPAVVPQEAVPQETVPTTPVLVQAKAPTVVFVIGESATRDHWQLYGYTRETTPLISARKAADPEEQTLFVFEDLLAPWVQTQEALFMLLTRATLDQRLNVVATMPQVLSHVGYRCVLLSAQPHWGIFDSIDALLFTGCEDRLYLDEIKPENERYDEFLLPYAEQELSETNDARPLALFVHLYGNHTPFDYRYPESAAFFSKDERSDVRHRSLASYDDSIRYTDRILDELIKLIEKSGRETVLIHLSDHGETPGSPNGRMLTDPSVWRVPFFVWCSPDYGQRHPDNIEALRRTKSLPLQADRLYDGLLQLADIRLKGREEESFLSTNFNWKIERRIENGKRAVDPGY